MDTKTFCGQCGTENPSDNNFCFKCGHKLVFATDNSTATETKPSTNSDYQDIKDTLQQLIKSPGFTIISIGDYYVQFSNNLNKQELYCDAVSSVFLPAIGNKDNEFKQLGFTPDPSANYYKFIPHSSFSADKTVQEMKTIFETIYRINFSSYKIETTFDDDVTKFQYQPKNTGCLGLIIIALLIGVYSIINS